MHYALKKNVSFFALNFMGALKTIFILSNLISRKVIKHMKWALLPPKIIHIYIFKFFLVALFSVKV